MPIDKPAAVRMTTGSVWKYSAAYFISTGRDLLAEVLRRPADHQPGHEHRDDGQDEEAVHASTDAAGGDLTERDVEQRDAAAERCQRVDGNSSPRRWR